MPVVGLVEPIDECSLLSVDFSDKKGLQCVASGGFFLPEFGRLTESQFQSVKRWRDLSGYSAGIESGWFDFKASPVMQR